MTKVQSYLASLPEEKRALFAPVYGDVDRFYTVVYLIAKNEHLTDLDKPDRYEDRLRMIRQVRSLVEKQLDGFGLDGESVVADGRYRQRLFRGFCQLSGVAPDVV